ncbi:hypothetical protein GWK47_049409 [Chionoecetes opilio]|uniref:Uncharacterized protein n=1 Tax=Chionoecetes opilio TaxID=41210 RepID=A0A8J4YB06_CHIOP|nr:hypothetical protein GWK47_049409 [Chionoecetes opilio]
MTLFDIGHADAFDLITVDEDRQFLLGQRCPDGPRGIMQGVDQSLADRERRRLERGVLKRSKLTGACHDCHAQLIGLGAGTKKRNGGCRGKGRGLRSERRNIRSIGLFPQASPTPIMTPSSLTMTLTLT